MQTTLRMVALRSIAPGERPEQCLASRGGVPIGKGEVGDGMSHPCTIDSIREAPGGPAKIASGAPTVTGRTTDAGALLEADSGGFVVPVLESTIDHLAEFEHRIG